MINSLVTDSHTNPSFSQTSKKINLNVTKSPVSNVTLHKNFSNNADSVNFNGLSGARLANTEILKTVAKVAKEFISENGQKATTKAVSNLVGEVVASVNDASQKIQTSDLAKGFLEKNRDTVTEFVNVSTDLIKQSKNNISPEKLASDLVEESRIAIQSLKAVEKTKANNGKSIYTSPVLEKIFGAASQNSAVFGAIYSAALACVLRPITILSMPAKGSNKEDNKYSASHSFASGITGTVVAFAFNNPLARGIKEFGSNPSKFLKGEALENFKKNFKYTGNAAISNKKYDIGVRALNLGTEVLLGVPQALLTIALIPPILKRLGVQKSSKKAPVQVAKTENKPEPTIVKNNVKPNTQKGAQISFGNGSNVSFGSSFSETIAKGVGKIFSAKPFVSFVERANAEKLIKYADGTVVKKENKLVANLSTLKSALISGLYVGRTLSNKNLDSNRKTTLAINQGAVWGVATLLGFTFNSAVDKLVDKFTNNFRAANVDKLMKRYNNDIGKADKAMNRLYGGIKTAKSLLIFLTVYRYISPVIVTPIANKIGNYVEARKKAKAQNVA